MMKIGYALLSLVLLTTLSYAAEETVYIGEEFLLKTKIVDDKGNLILVAKVKAVSEFFSAELYDDGLHEDGIANDGIYASRILVNAPKGIYNVKILVEKETYSDTQELTLNIVEKPKYNLFIYAGVVVLIILALVFVTRVKGKKEKSIEGLKELRERKKHIKEMMEKAKEAYYNRELDEQQFNRTIEKYEQDLIDIDVKMKESKKR